MGRSRRGSGEMIIIDTNVASALMRLELEPAVAAWIDEQDLESIFLTSVSIFEIQFGVERAPHGRKRVKFAADFAALLSQIVPGRIIELDRSGAIAAAAVHVAKGKAKAKAKARAKCGGSSLRSE